MAKHRSHSIAFKRQAVREYLAGETLHGLARRHDLSRILIRIWVDKYEAGAFDEDAEAASTIQECEARIAALKRLGGNRPAGAMRRLPPVSPGPAVPTRFATALRARSPGPR